MKSSAMVVRYCCVLVGILALAVSCAAASSRAYDAGSDTKVTPATPSDYSALAPPVTITVSPKRAAVVTVTQTQQFNSSVIGVTWSIDGIVGGNSTVGMISSSGLYTPPATGGNHTVTATSGASSGTASIAVSDLTGVFTYHNGQARNGVNSREFGLRPSTVTTASFGKLFSCSVDGAVYAQPLWVRDLSIGGGTHNVIFVATQHDSIYAFDADAKPCVTYWHVNLLDTLHGGSGTEKPVTWNDVGNCFGDIYPEVGVTGTPVISPTTKTIYLVSASESNPTGAGRCSGTSGTFYHRLHALDLATGSEKHNAPVTIAAEVPGTGDGSVSGMVSFNSQLHHQRSGLALYGGKLYVAFSAHEDANPYHGWVISYNASNVHQQLAVFNTTPNGLNGSDGGIWGGGGAPAIDSGGDIYVTTGNGVFDQAPPSPDNDYGDSILRLHSFKGSTSNGVNLSVAGWFTPYDQSTLAQSDTDLGSGAAILLPDQTGSGPTHLLAQVGKEGTVYLIDRDNMGQFNPSNDSQIVQSFHGPANGLWGTPALWHNYLYTGGRRDSLKQFTFDPSKGMFFPTSATSQSAHVFNYPGSTPSISSLALTRGIVWAIDSSLFGYASPSGGVNCYTVPVPASCTGPAVLHAYSAADLGVEYWNSSMAAGNRDRAGNAVKFVPPMIANGKVYLGTRTEVDVYGLLP